MTRLHHGEIILEQLVTSLRSAAYFDLNAEKYEFWHEDAGGAEPEDMLSWVSGTMAFIPPRYPTQQGLHRLYVSMEKIDGVRGLAVAAYPHLVDPENDDVKEVEPWLVSSRVVGLNVRFYSVSEEDWEDEWEKERQLPQFIELTLLMEPEEEGGDPKKLIRQIHIPLGKVSRDTRRGKRKVDDAAETASTNQTKTGDTRDDGSQLPPPIK